jgi:hypothetical protein
MQGVDKHVLSGLLLLMLFVLAVGSSDGGKSGPNKIDAFVMCQEAVKRRLKAPATADFPWYSDSFVRYLDVGRFRVSAYVDAENSFGAKIRSYYTCVVKSTDGHHWTLESIEID